MIETKTLSKHFGRLVAVDGLSFRVEPGEVLGFLGPNGAGKSTSMKMIAGFLAPTSGSATVCGHDVGTDPIAAKTVVGYLPEGAPSYGEMTPLSFLNFVADIRNLRGAVRKQRLDLVIGELHLEKVLGQAIETLSKGFKRRVGLAQAILHDPKVLILDEPTDGLDPNQKHEVRSLINSISADKIIVISTHILEEVHAVCSRAIIIADGRLLADDTPDALEARSRYHNAVNIKPAGPEQVETIKSGLRAVDAVASIEMNTETGRIVAIPKDGKSLLSTIGALAVRNHWDIEELQVETGRLDEVFREITTAKPEAAA